MENGRSRIPSPGDRHDASARRGVRTYYQRAGIGITDHYLTVGGRRYAVVELYDVWTVRGPRDPLGVGAAIAAMVVLALAVGCSYYGLPVISAGIAAFSLVPAGLALTAWKTRRRHYELWAEYQGAEIQVLTVLDGEVYGQICRALIRARESRDVQPTVEWRGMPDPSPAF